MTHSDSLPDPTRISLGRGPEIVTGPTAAPIDGVMGSTFDAMGSQSTTTDLSANPGASKNALGVETNPNIEVFNSLTSYFEILAGIAEDNPDLKQQLNICLGTAERIGQPIQFEDVATAWIEDDRGLPAPNQNRADSPLDTDLSFRQHIDDATPVTQGDGTPSIRGQVTVLVRRSLGHNDPRVTLHGVQAAVEYMFDPLLEQAVLTDEQWRALAAHTLSLPEENEDEVTSPMARTAAGRFTTGVMLETEAPELSADTQPAYITRDRLESAINALTIAMKKADDAGRGGAVSRRIKKWIGDTHTSRPDPITWSSVRNAYDVQGVAPTIGRPAAARPDPTAEDYLLLSSDRDLHVTPPHRSEPILRLLKRHGMSVDEWVGLAAFRSRVANFLRASLASDKHISIEDVLSMVRHDLQRREVEAS